MKILHVYKDYFPVLGGIENHVRDLARAQAALGHDVTVLVTAPDARTHVEDDAGARIVKAARFATVASTPLSVALPLALRRERPDVVHLHFPYPVGEMANLVFHPGRATVITYHSDIVRQKMILAVYEPFLRRVLAKAQRIIATTPSYVASSPYLRPHAAKIDIVPFGVDFARFGDAPAGRVEELRRRLAPADGSPLFVSVGRMRYYKGLDHAIRAMRDVPGRLVLVGSGPMEAEWRALAHDLGLDERVTFAGEVDDAELPAWFHAADAYVSSASHRSEAFGISIIEAMACGKPVISTELGTGTSFVNRHEETGLVVPARDEAALAAAMRTLGDPALRARHGAAALARARAEFTAERMNERVLESYRRALAS